VRGAPFASTKERATYVNEWQGREHVMDNITASDLHRFSRGQCGALCFHYEQSRRVSDSCLEWRAVCLVNVAGREGELCFLTVPGYKAETQNRHLGRSMALAKGDWVRTDTGEVGKIVLVNRVSAFILIPAEGKDTTLVSYLISRLTKIAPPNNHLNNSPQPVQ
jgi:hypothetical protein